MGNAPGQPHLSPQSIHHSYAQPAHGIDKGETPLPHLLVGEHVHTCTSRAIRRLLLLSELMKSASFGFISRLEPHLHIRCSVHSYRAPCSQTYGRGTP